MEPKKKPVIEIDLETITNFVSGAIVTLVIFWILVAILL